MFQSRKLSRDGSRKPTTDLDVAIPPSIPSSTTHGVLTTTMNDLPGYRITKVLGTVYGLTVRSRNLGADIVSGLKSLAGGEIRYFTNMMYTSRNEAVERMVGDCMGRGGNAVIAMRFDAGDIGLFAQVCAYGTAVIVEAIDGERMQKKETETVVEKNENGTE